MARPTAPGILGGRAVAGWQIAFWLLLALAFLTQLAPGDDPLRARVAGCAVLVTLGVTFALTVGRWRECVTGTPAVVYVVTAILLTGVACALDTELALLLFIVYPQVWMYTESFAAGALGAVGLAFASFGGFFVQFGFTRDSLLRFGPQMAASVLFSLLLGFWIYRVIRESLDRASLIAQLEATRAELAEAHHAQGVMAERERMAREIHDTLAQGFTSVIMLAQTAAAGLRVRPRAVDEAVARLAQVEDVARENLAEARALVAAFTPVSLSDATLVEAITRLGERFGRETGIAVRVEVGGALSTLSRDQEVVLVRAAQEALTNVRRHARATNVVLRLTGEAGSARIEVVDDGVGFDPGSRTPEAGFGLDGMRGRATEVGGDVRVASRPGAGTRVSVSLPLGGPGIGAEPGGGPAPSSSAAEAGR